MIRETISLVMIVMFTIGAVCASAGSARKTTIAELMTSPRDYFDQRIDVTGFVLTGPWGPDLCELPSRIADGERHCIDLDDINLLFPANRKSLHGALVRLVGYFAHPCAPPNRKKEGDEEVMVVCADRGGDGWLVTESMSLSGYINPCPGIYCRKRDDWVATAISADSTNGLGVSAFVQRLLNAQRSASEDEIIDLVLPTMRSAARSDLANKVESAERFLRPTALRSALPSAGSEGGGFRLFRIEHQKSHEVIGQKLCICPKGNCGEEFPEAALDARGPITFSIFCYDAWRGPSGWSLLYY